MTDPLRQLEAELVRLRALRDRTLTILSQAASDPVDKLRLIELAFDSERDIDAETEEAGDRERLS
jgi:hypothetical protein